MDYKIDDLPLGELIGPVSAASAALSRLDERLVRSPIKDGWIERQQFFDACASLWLDGELVHVEDLVLHDARMDVRAPTHELTQAHAVLRSRRHIMTNKPDWALSTDGLRNLRGRGAGRDAAVQNQMSVAKAHDRVSDTLSSDAALTRELLAMDQLLMRTQRVLAQSARSSLAASAPELKFRSAHEPTNRDPLVYEEEWDDEEKFAQWRAALDETRAWPPVMRTALLLDTWRELSPLQRSPWLGRLFCAALLRETGVTSTHLAALNVGLKTVPREKRTSQDKTTRILALIEALAQTAALGLKEHDRLILAHDQMQRKLKGKRSNSKLPQLIALVLARPLVTSTLIEKELKLTLQGALNLVGELGLREVTGRGRYRAWSAV